MPNTPPQNANARAPGTTSAQDPAAPQAADHLADLKSHVVAPWLALVEAIPLAADATKVAQVRDTVYSLLLNKTQGFEAFDAYLMGDAVLDPYKQAAEASATAVGSDGDLKTTIVAFATAENARAPAAPTTGGNAVASANTQRLHTECLTSYLKLPSAGRHYLRDQPYVTGLADADLKKILRGETTLAPIDAAPVAPAVAPEDHTLDPIVDKFKQRITDMPTEGGDHAARKLLSEDLGSADGRVL